MLMDSILEEHKEEYTIPNPMAVEPIDDYVRSMLEKAAKRWGLSINTDEPTRLERFAAARAYANAKEFLVGVEIMEGQQAEDGEQKMRYIHHSMYVMEVESYPALLSQLPHTYNPSLTPQH
ncbi:MAG: hypothetical protein KJ709_07020 [Nanoarchaeota archaeon]|nr:hypothetical protein [Nanoarchaeota archaeon]